MPAEDADIGWAEFSPPGFKEELGLKLRVCIAVFFAVLLAAGATSSILEMAPPIRGLALADLRDTFARSSQRTAA